MFFHDFVSREDGKEHVSFVLSDPSRVCQNCGVEHTRLGLPTFCFQPPTTPGNAGICRSAGVYEEIDESTSEEYSEATSEEVDL